MDEDDERAAAKDAPPDRDTSHEHEGVWIEGMRPPLTREQRRRRVALTAIVVASALAVLLWPALSSLASRFHPVEQGALTTAPGYSAGQTVAASQVTVAVNAGPGGLMCPVTPQTPSSVGAPELHADSIGNGDVWALLLSGADVVAGQDTNIVWRSTGSGGFRVTANGPDNTGLGPVFPPNPHSGSSWQRPGDEWGTIFNFPKPGCWQLQVTRGADLNASLWLDVSAGQTPSRGGG